MKNFLNRLATDLTLEVVVNGNTYQHGLHDAHVFLANAVVTIDGHDVLPKFWHLSKDGLLKIDEPFYCWHHRVSGQGWLLTPH